MKRFSITPLIFAICFTLSSVTAIQAQITITSSDIERPVGEIIRDEATTSGSLTVDVGQTGGPQSWDLTSYDCPYSSVMEVVDASGTPFAGDFPGANQCFMVSEDGGGESYSYMNVMSDMWTWLGFGVDFAESSFVRKYNPPGEIPLPISMGSSWIFETGWSDTIMIDTLMIITSYVDKSHNTVDAWGTLTIPMGTYDVLRSIEYDTTIISGGFPPFEYADTSTTIGYSWLSKELLFVADVVSQEGETDPNFTIAEYIDRATYPVGIAGDETPEKAPLAFGLDQNFPNPFNPQTEITFHVPEKEAGLVELCIYSLRGARVKTLVSGSIEAGRHTVSWDGRDELGAEVPSGVYFYRLSVAGKSINRKMVLAR